MAAAHAKLQINYEDFFYCKLIMWEALKQLRCNFETMFTVLQEMERIRFFVDIRDSVLQKLGGPEQPKL